MVSDWQKLINKIINREISNTYCPDCGNMNLDFQYFGDKNTRIGFLVVWCRTCNHGFNFSRVNVPLGFEMMEFPISQEVFSRRVPDFKMIDPG